MDDDELVRLCQNGDVSAFEQLFNRHRKRVFNLVYRMMGNEEDAFDLTQEIFVRVYTKIHDFGFKSAFSTWLYRLALNMCTDELRKRARDMSTPVEPDSPTISQQVYNTNPEKQLMAKEYEKQIWKAINSLKEKDRSMIILRDLEGLSYEEIAKVLDCSVGRVKSRLHEARKKLKSILENKTSLWIGGNEIEMFKSP